MINPSFNASSVMRMLLGTCWPNDTHTATEEDTSTIETRVSLLTSGKLDGPLAWHKPTNISVPRPLPKSTKTITFIADFESKGNSTDPSTMDYFNGVKYPQLSLLVSYLRQCGQPVKVVDWEDETCNWHKKKQLVLGPVWGYTKNLDKFFAWLEMLDKIGANLTNSPKFLRWNVMKTYLLDLAKANIPIPYSLIVDDDHPLSFEEAKTLFSQTDFILKGVVDSGASGYMHVDQDQLTEASAHYDKLIKEHKGAILQSFIPEIKKKGELSFVFFDDMMSHFFVKVPNDNEERSQPFYGGKSFHLSRNKIKEQIEAIKTSFRPDFELKEKDVSLALVQVKEIYGKLMKLLSEVNIPNPKYLRIDVVMVKGRCLVMEIEGIEPYLEMKEEMHVNHSNPVLNNYTSRVLNLTVLAFNNRHRKLGYRRNLRPTKHSSPS
jgi:glutathione synthase/RimK-type ligase-like ATP-grasp enzyme